MNETPKETPKVYSAIVAVSSELSKVGIAKDRYNEQQRFKFRGIDDFFNALSMPLAKNNLTIFPRYYDRTVITGETKSGSTLYFVSIKCDFTFVCATDGSSHTATIVGEAMDMADKATNKAMSACYKYMAAQVLCIPVEGLDDSDAAQTEEVASKPADPPATLSKAQIDTIEELLIDLSGEEGAVHAGAAILKFLEHEHWSNVPATRYEMILASIAKKKAAKGKAS